MFYFLLFEHLHRLVGPFRVFRYATFRTAFASLTALFLCIALGPWLIRKLQDLQMDQPIRQDGPDSHQAKKGTPTMGGVMVIPVGDGRVQTLQRITRTETGNQVENIEPVVFVPLVGGVTDG